jgi:alpha-beta hydrolase superfamily lysophospholipase
MRLSVVALLALLGLAACEPYVVERGPVIGPARMQAEAIIASDNTRLPLKIWLPDGPPKAVVLGLHGYGDYSRAFEKPGPLWAQGGIATYAYDQRGFGATASFNRWSGVPVMIEDMKAAIGLLRARHPGIPLYVVGESMGGSIAMAALGGENPPKLDGLILIGPAVRGRETLGAVGRGGLSFFAHSIPWFPVSTVGMDYQPTNNLALLQELSKDPLIIKTPRVDTVWGLVDAMDAALAAAPRMKPPLLILYGQNDRLVPRDIMKLMLSRLPKDQGIRIASYAKGYHMLLRDLDGALVQRDALAWMQDHNAPLPSGAEQAAARFFAEPKTAP